MLGETIAIYAITDDMLKAIGHREDMRVQLSALMITTASLSCTRFFGGNY